MFNTGGRGGGGGGNDVDVILLGYAVAMHSRN